MGYVCPKCALAGLHASYGACGHPIARPSTFPGQASPPMPGQLSLFPPASKENA